jgi:hypothetical protein
VKGTYNYKDTTRTDIAFYGETVDVVAQFSMIPNTDTCKLTYMVYAGQENMGSLRVNARGVVMESAKYSMTVVSGAAGFEVTAVPAKGYAFVGWSDAKKEPVRMDASWKDTAFTAMFERDSLNPYSADKYYSIIYSSGSGGQLRKGGEPNILGYTFETLKEGARGSMIAAVSDNNFRFVKWNDGVKTLARSDSAERSATLIAVFEELADGIKINNLEELQKIGNDPAYPLTGRYALMNDIDAAAAVGFQPLGGNGKPPFSGIFDGNMKKISGLNINRAEGFAGLFGYAENARISRVVLAGPNVTGGSAAGALVGRCVNTAIDSCGVDGGSVTGADSAAGGLVGSAVSSLISRSYSTAQVAGKNGTGGLAGVAAGSMITHCYAAKEGDESVKGDTGVGGLAGRVENGVAQYSYAVISTHGSSAVGGFVGEAARGAYFHHSYSAGGVVGAGGGFAGASGAGADARMCYWDIAVSTRQTSALGEGKESEYMIYADSYRDGGGEFWDFENVWDILREGENYYPYLREVVPAKQPTPGMMAKPRQASSALSANSMPVKVRGRVMTVNAPRGAAWQVRIIDMRGRTIARYNVQSAARIALNKIPSGRYLVETRDMGKRRVDVSAVVLK